MLQIKTVTRGAIFSAILIFVSSPCRADLVITVSDVGDGKIEYVFNGTLTTNGSYYQNRQGPIDKVLHYGTPPGPPYYGLDSIYFWNFPPQPNVPTNFRDFANKNTSRILKDTVGLNTGSALEPFGGPLVNLHLSNNAPTSVAKLELYGFPETPNVVPTEITWSDHRSTQTFDFSNFNEGTYTWGTPGGDTGDGITLIVSSQSTVQVDIDIKPGSDPNSINLCSNGAVPIAIFGSESLDVEYINTETLRFAESAVKMVGKKDPYSLCSLDDVDGDTYLDLVCHFMTSDIAAINGESTTATVNGELDDGTAIEGTDSVNIVKECL